MHMIITLNVNGLIVPIKKNRVAEWIQKQDPNIYCIEETPNLNIHTDRK